MLTWLKIFKYLNYFPNMQILTRTLAAARWPLMSFSAIMSVVLIGCGHSFFLAFNLDIIEYRTFFNSVMALLRMAVGDFNYNDLESSHNIVGCALCHRRTICPPPLPLPLPPPAHLHICSPRPAEERGPGSGAAPCSSGSTSS
eukprot:COSAG01_NODE_5194_length_4419_cov_6.478752_8_plen_143_part_00